jgi:hypothetical protein
VGRADDVAATARSLRELAPKARHIALAMSRQDDYERLQQYANELEEQAAKLEASLVTPDRPVTHEQQQVQQPQEQEPDSDNRDS